MGIQYNGVEGMMGLLNAVIRGRGGEVMM